MLMAQLPLLYPKTNSERYAWIPRKERRQTPSSCPKRNLTESRELPWLLIRKNNYRGKRSWRSRRNSS